MKKHIPVFFICLAVFVGACCFLSPKAEAADELVWTTTDLYYEVDSDGMPEDILVIEGYFTNNTHRYVNYFYEFNVTATISADIGAGYTGQVHGVFRNFEMMIEPYSSANHRFRVRGARIIWPVEDYEVIQGFTKWKHSGAAG